MSKDARSESKHFVLQQLAEGAFAAIAEDGGAAISNSGLIDLGGQVVVFDTFLTPQAAADLRRMAEDLTEHYKELNVKVAYLHSDIDTLERVDIIRDLRMGKYDVLIGINLLREGLDIPEVSLVAILDADKEGFLRSARSLIQTMGRAARNVNGEVILYAENMTDSMRNAIAETNRRRTVQEEYNKEHNITPISIKKSIQATLRTVYEQDYFTVPIAAEEAGEYVQTVNIPQLIASLEKQMRAAAKELDVETAAGLRDKIWSLRQQEMAVGVKVE